MARSAADSGVAGTGEGETEAPGKQRERVVGASGLELGEGAVDVDEEGAVVGPRGQFAPEGLPALRVIVRPGDEEEGEGDGTGAAATPASSLPTTDGGDAAPGLSPSAGSLTSFSSPSRAARQYRCVLWIDGCVDV